MSVRKNKLKLTRSLSINELLFSKNQQQRLELLKIYQAALHSVHGKLAVSKKIAGFSESKANFTLISIGKAASSMAQGALEVLGDQIQNGLVISKTGHVEYDFPERIQCMESDHPIPSEKSLTAGKRLLEFCQRVPPGQLVVFCISGGASSLVEVLEEGTSLSQLQEKNRELIAGGFSINEINRVRKRLSRIKGGKLAKFFSGQPINVLVISDVKDDDLSVIGSGMLFKKNKTEIRHSIVASLDQAKEAARDKALSLGYPCYSHQEFLEADIVSVANHVFSTLDNAETGIHLWGGEPTLKLPEAPGDGGRNQHLALTLAEKIQGRDDLIVLVAATDGTDGSTSDAGAIVDGGTILRGEDAGLNSNQSLLKADSGSFLQAAGDLITTGPTHTNVMDLLIALKLER